MADLRVYDHTFKYHRKGGNEVVFEMHDYDDGGSVEYYGYVNEAGAWIIKKHDSTAKTFRFAAGQSDYSTNWGNRASLSYDYLYNLL
ncbi:MAG: hypothetical protein KatS3mg087_1655 [Patescibacteria group bacterium]|nr:MAG: hypothetical protein KatS3mg087_1655 [Patescibacteria group bacterium]